MIIKKLLLLVFFNPVHNIPSLCDKRSLRSRCWKKTKSLQLGSQSRIGVLGSSRSSAAPSSMHALCKSLIASFTAFLTAGTLLPRKSKSWL